MSKAFPFVLRQHCAQLQICALQKQAEVRPYDCGLPTLCESHPTPSFFNKFNRGTKSSTKALTTNTSTPKFMVVFVKKVLLKPLSSLEKISFGEIKNQTILGVHFLLQDCLAQHVLVVVRQSTNLLQCLADLMERAAHLPSLAQSC